MGLFGNSQPSAIEKAVAKATDESLTRENWSLIIDALNQVTESKDPEDAARQAVSAVRKRLECRNGNVQLYALTLLNALAQNCGTMVHREIGSTTTTQLLQRLGTSPQTHRSVVKRLLEILDGLSQQFASDPSLKQVQIAYDRVLSAHPELGSPQKTIHKPHRNSRTHRSRTEEHVKRKQVAPPAPNAPAATVDDDDDEDLKRALQLSLQEAKRNGTLPADSESTSPLAVTAGSSASTATGGAANSDSRPKKVKALFDFTASEPGELTFRVGDVINVVEGVYQDWWRGSVGAATGIFPINYVEPLTDDAAENGRSNSSAATPVDDEAYIFAQMPTVEKLLSIFSAASQNPSYGILGNQDVQQLYHDVSAIRPRLLQLIEEYTRKKDELLILNSRLLETRRAYNRLVESSSQSTPSAGFSSIPTAPDYSAPSPGYGFTNDLNGHDFGRGYDANSATALPVNRPSVTEYSAPYEPQPGSHQMAASHGAHTPVQQLPAASVSSVQTVPAAIRDNEQYRVPAAQPIDPNWYYQQQQQQQQQLQLQQLQQSQHQPQQLQQSQQPPLQSQQVLSHLSHQQSPHSQSPAVAEVQPLPHQNQPHIARSVASTPYPVDSSRSIDSTYASPHPALPYPDHPDGYAVPLAASAPPMPNPYS